MHSNCAGNKARNTHKGLNNKLYKHCSHGFSHEAPPQYQSKRPIACSTSLRSTRRFSTMRQESNCCNFCFFALGKQTVALEKWKSHPIQEIALPSCNFSQLIGIPIDSKNINEVVATSGATSAGSKRRPSSTYTHNACGIQTQRCKSRTRNEEARENQ